MTRALRRFSVLPILLLVLSTFACNKGKVGDKCTAGAVTCADGKSALCASGAYAKEACGGPKGCIDNGDVDICDNSVAAEKDGCDTPADYACTTDKKSLLRCKDSAWTATAACRGPRECQIHGDKLLCDNDFAELNDVCDEPGDYACSTDKKSALRCKDNKFQTESTCLGPHACTVTVKDTTATIRCDDDVANLNDPCKTDGDYACSTDKKTMLRCKGNKFLSINACRGTNGCIMREHPEKKVIEFTCDDSVAEVGDDCDENGEQACSVDGKSLLGCGNGKFAVTKACPKKACKMVSDTKSECG